MFAEADSSFGISSWCSSLCRPIRSERSPAVTFAPRSSDRSLRVSPGCFPCTEMHHGRFMLRFPSRRSPLRRVSGSSSSIVPVIDPRPVPPHLCLKLRPRAFMRALMRARGPGRQSVGATRTLQIIRRIKIISVGVGGIRGLQKKMKS